MITDKRFKMSIFGIALVSASVIISTIVGLPASIEYITSVSTIVLAFIGGDSYRKSEKN